MILSCRQKTHPSPAKVILLLLPLLLIPAGAGATQFHSSSEGILVHQVGHLFFLVSMVVLIFTIQGKQLNHEKGWRWIQISAVFFILWNLDAMMAHFLDNQSGIITTPRITMSHIDIDAGASGDGLARFYYLLRLDHLLCLPAMIFLYCGLCHILKEEEK